MGSKFGAATVTTDPDRSATKNILTGGPNVGKTYFASTIGGVFIIPIEEGLKGASPHHSPAHFKFVPDTLTELHEALREFETLNVPQPPPGTPGNARPDPTWKRPHYHLALDSLTGIERLVHAAACGAEKVKHMEDKDFKKVWNAALPLWEGILAALDRIRRGGVHVWIIAHAVEDFDSAFATGEVFKRWDLMFRGSGKTLADVRHLWRSWADNIYYLVKQHRVRKGDKTRRTMAEFGGRVLITQETATCAAKSRGNLPPSLPATWEDLKRAMASGVPAKPDKLLAQIRVIAADLDPEERDAIEADIERAAGSATRLAATLSRAQGMADVAMRDRGDDYPASEDEGGGDPEAAPVFAHANPAQPGDPVAADLDRQRRIDLGLE